jgi:hypothetical protein
MIQAYAASGSRTPLRRWTEGEARFSFRLAASVSGHAVQTLAADDQHQPKAECCFSTRPLKSPMPSSTGQPRGVVSRSTGFDGGSRSFPTPGSPATAPFSGVSDDCGCGTEPDRAAAGARFSSLAVVSHSAGRVPELIRRGSGSRWRSRRRSPPDRAWATPGAGSVSPPRRSPSAGSDPVHIRGTPRPC